MPIYVSIFSKIVLKCGDLWSGAPRTHLSSLSKNTLRSYISGFRYNAYVYNFAITMLSFQN